MSLPLSGRCPLARVLFADDDPVVRRSFERAVRAAGYVVDVACDGGEALSMAAQHDYGVLAIDYQMPGVCGKELISALRRLHPDAALLIVTGHSDLAIESCRIPGVSLVISKPWDEDALLSLLAVSQELRARQTG